MDILKEIIDSLGAAVVVPIVIFIIAKVFKVTTKKSFLAAMYAGVGLAGFMLLINAFTPIISPVIQRMVNNTGVNLPVFDVGWQATSLVAYSTDAGMLYLGIGIVLQTVLFLIKWTDVFQPSDLWNNYSYMVWGAMVTTVTGSFTLGITCMILMNLYSLLISVIAAKAWENTDATFGKIAITALVEIPTLKISPHAIIVVIRSIFPIIPINIPKTRPKVIGSPKKPNFSCTVCGFNLILLSPKKL